MEEKILFDIAALVQLATVIFYYSLHKAFGTKRQIGFLYVFQFTSLAVILEIFVDFMKQYHFIVTPLCYLITAVQMGMFVFSILLFTRNVIMQQDMESRGGLEQSVLFLVPLGISFLLIILNFTNHFLFSYDDDGNFIKGKGLDLIYVLLLYIFLAVIFETIRFRKVSSKLQKAASVMYVFFLLIAVLVERLMPNLHIILFALVVSEIMHYYSSANPEKYLDKELELLNRTAFNESVSTEFLLNSRFQVLSIQVMGLSFIADYLGVTRADQLRVTVAKKLKEIVGGKHAVYYLGQDRFSVLANIEWPLWTQYIKEIEQAFSHRFLLDGMNLELHAAKCMISCPEYAHNPKELSDMMLLTLMESMQSNKRDVVYPSEEYIQKGERERKIMLLLQEAIREGKMEIFYQPVFNTEKNNFDSAKALLRMKDDVMGEITPNEFIPIAEKSGLMVDIEKFVFTETCRLIYEQHLEELGLDTIYINLSSLSCLQEDLAGQIEQILKEYPLGKVKIGFEVAENIASSRDTIFERNMRALTDMGFFFVLDATNHGYADVQLLKRYRFDIVKVSRLVIWEMLKDKDSTDALVHIMRLLHQLDCKIIAEGMENQDHINLFTKMNVDFLQGFYYSKPVRAIQWAEYMKNHNFKGENE